ncbi:unnamed protein product [Scytosiphon promiscuus]
MNLFARSLGGIYSGERRRPNSQQLYPTPCVSTREPPSEPLGESQNPDFGAADPLILARGPEETAWKSNYLPRVSSFWSCALRIQPSGRMSALLAFSTPPTTFTLLS